MFALSLSLFFLFIFNKIYYGQGKKIILSHFVDESIKCERTGNISDPFAMPPNSKTNVLKSFIHFWGCSFFEITLFFEEWRRRKIHHSIWSVSFTNTRLGQRYMHKAYIYDIDLWWHLQTNMLNRLKTFSSCFWRSVS